MWRKTDLCSYTVCQLSEAEKGGLGGMISSPVSPLAGMLGRVRGLRRVRVGRGTGAEPDTSTCFQLECVSIFPLPFSTPMICTYIQYITSCALEGSTSLCMSIYLACPVSPFCPPSRTCGRTVDNNYRHIRQRIWTWEVL